MSNNNMPSNGTSNGTSNVINIGEFNMCELITLIFLLLIVIAIIATFTKSSMVAVVSLISALLLWIFGDVNITKFINSMNSEQNSPNQEGFTNSTFDHKYKLPPGVSPKFVCANCNPICSDSSPCATDTCGTPCPQCNVGMTCPVPGCITENYKLNSPPNTKNYEGDCECTEGYNEHNFPGFTEGFSAMQCGADQTNNNTDKDLYNPMCCTGSAPNINANGLDHFNRGLGLWMTNEGYTYCYPPIAKELSNVREFQQYAEPMNMIPFNGTGVPIDEKNTMMAMGRERNKKTLDGLTTKTAEYYKKNYGDELSVSEAKVWWGANEY